MKRQRNTTGKSRDLQAAPGEEERREVMSCVYPSCMMGGGYNPHPTEEEEREVKIPIIFGWISIHRNVQVGMGGYKPLIGIHWVRADWQKCSLVSRRLLLVYGVSA